MSDKISRQEKKRIKREEIKTELKKNWDTYCNNVSIRLAFYLFWILEGIIFKFSFLSFWGLAGFIGILENKVFDYKLEQKHDRKHKYPKYGKYDKLVIDYFSNILEKISDLPNKLKEKRQPVIKENVQVIDMPLRSSNEIEKEKNQYIGLLELLEKYKAMTDKKDLDIPTPTINFDEVIDQAQYRKK